MRLKLQIKRTAALAIVEQADYYAARSSEKLARRWESAVDSAIRGLLSMPERGALCQFRNPELSGIRRLAVSGFPNHLVFYRLDGKTVTVLHVLHGARNLEAVLSNAANEPLSLHETPKV